MVFDNSEALIEHLKTLGKVIQRGSQLEYIESRKIARPEKEMPREALQLAHKLAKNVKEHFDFVKLEQKDIERWASDIEKLHRIDGQDWKAIEWVIEWVHQNSFWCQNIRSGQTLRAKFEELKIRIKSEENSEEEKKHSMKTANRYVYKKTTQIPSYVVDERTGKRGNELL